MFCPSCGTESTGLNYCNRCGTNLGSLNAVPEVVQVNVAKPAAIIGSVTAFITLGGFALIISGARALAPVLNGSDPLMAMILFGMVTILVVDILLLRQLTRLINASLRPDVPKALRQMVPAGQLPRPSNAQFIPAGSVTENTTRFLENAYPAPAETPADRSKS